MWLIICSESSEIISCVVGIDTTTSWDTYTCFRESSLFGNILTVDLGGQPLARTAWELFGERKECYLDSLPWWENCFTPSQWCMLNGFCVKASYCWCGDLRVFAHLSSSAPHRGKGIQASVPEGWTKWHYQAEPCAHCSKFGSELLQVIQMRSIWGRTRVQLILIVRFSCQGPVNLITPLE